jgi:hypothetical protein
MTSHCVKTEPQREKGKVEVHHLPKIHTGNVNLCSPTHINAQMSLAARIAQGRALAPPNRPFARKYSTTSPPPHAKASSADAPNSPEKCPKPFPTTVPEPFQSGQRQGRTDGSGEGGVDPDGWVDGWMDGWIPVLLPTNPRPPTHPLTSGAEQSRAEQSRAELS